MNNKRIAVLDMVDFSQKMNYIKYTIVSILFISCGNSNNNDNSRDLYESLIYSQFNLPDSVEVLSTNNIDYTDIIDTDYKIATYIDGDCFSCIFEIESWGEIVDVISGVDDISLLIYVYAQDIERFMQFYYPSIQSDHPIIIDYDNRYILNNGLDSVTNRNFLTFLLNDDNEIVRIGNPTLNENIRDFYLQTIEEL